MDRLLALPLIVALLSGCGGDGGDTGGAVGVTPAPTINPSPTPAPTPSPTPTPVASACVETAQTGGSNTATLTTARYLGGGTGDALNVSLVSPGCAIYAGGQITGFAGAARPIGATGATATGVLLRLDADGRGVTGAVRLGTAIADGDLDPTSGDVVIASDAGLARLSGDLGTTRWAQDGVFTRVSIAGDGTVAALGGTSGKRLHVFSPAGALRYTRDFGDSMVNDVVAMSNGGALRIVVTGMAQRDGGGCSQLQVAWLRAYDGDNAQVWRGYDWLHAEAFARDSSCADTRGYRVAAGADGRLYFAGESSGGNSIFRFGSLDLAASAPNVRTDAFNDAFNTASNQIGYLARLDPLTGAVEAGSFLLSRLPNSRGNTIRPRALAARADGTIYVGGVSAAFIPNRQGIVLNGTTLADYAGGDPWLLVLAADFATRRAWLAFADGGQGEVRSVGVNGSRVALAAQATGKGANGRALYTTPSTDYTGAQAGWLAVLPRWR